MKKPKKRKLRKSARPHVGNYVKKVMELGVPSPGTVAYVRVLHDDDCGIFSGQSCDCVLTLVVHPNLN